MKAPRKDAARTRRRLLAVAGEVFARKGFRGTTVAEICRKAGANVAAVNYHFGSKENLYVESWRYAFEKSLKAYPPDGGVPADAPAEERLHGRILSLMRRIADPKNHEFEIGHRELVTQTGLLAKVMRRSIEPMHRALREIVRDLLGDKATERQVRACQRSIMDQCFGPMIFERHRRKLPRGLAHVGPPPLDVSAEVLADHVTRFSLAGIREIRRRNAAPRRRKGRSK